MKNILKLNMQIPTDDFVNLRVNRLIFYALFTIFINPVYFLKFSQYPSQLWLPTGILQLLSAPPLFSDLQIKLFSWLWYLTGFLSALNILYKFNSRIFFLITFIMFNVADSYGYQTHTYMPIVLASAVMAFGGEKKTFLLQFIFCSVFFMAGLSKLRNGGLDWFLTESLQNILLRSQIYYSDVHQLAHKFNLNILLAKHLLLTKFVAFFVVALELLAPLALVLKRHRLLVVLFLLLMQIGIYFTILVNFKVYALLYIFWIDWSCVISKLRATYTYFQNNHNLKVFKIS